VKKEKENTRLLEYVPETQKVKENKSKIIKTVKLDKKTL
tara:strand:- start:2550 stop:2666 length:117 start_codon:yes stop_codon:yes gene_type:complete